MNDAIIVLANLMDPNGNLNDETLARLSTAVGLLEAGAAPVIAPCGWANRNDICIADAMAKHAEFAMGVPSSKIVTESTSRDTVGDAVFSKRNLYNARDWQNIIVVTSAYHADRAQKIFSFVYGRTIEVVPAASDDTPSLRASEAKSIEAFQVTFSGVKPGDDAAIFARLKSSHPFYNGKIHPAIGD